ncbi:hypothetical protein EV702DRAFT_1204719 [Suillus placidus]|uniref:Uncharacterized protein n=1 Tax=Suillus placidus TaxID=48579 RepID=A0A9P6ZGE7_9AGAM|nr:hypothetical protein EV702DRAFT_1204719 [Suillus placidus]
MFIAYLLNQIPSMPVHVMYSYGPCKDFKEWKIEDATNILYFGYISTSFAFAIMILDYLNDESDNSQKTITLHLQDTLHLNRLMINQYNEFVANAPADWLKDGWLQHCEVVRGWVQVPVNDILSVHDVIYNSPDLDVRQPVDLPLLPLHEPGTQREIKVYDKEGRHIPCFIGRTHINSPECGILINLETIPQLFSLYVAHDEHLNLDADILDIDDRERPSINVYPQAFLWKYGHLQSSSILPHFKTFIKIV